MTATTALTVEQFRDAVAAAVRAPSMYNVQPWRFALRDGCVEVSVDDRRRLPVADPSGWAARVACGAAIADLRLALASAGIGTEVRLARPADDPLVASIVPTGPYTASPRERALYAAIPVRRSDRRPYFDVRVPTPARARLEAAAAEAGARLTLTDDRQDVANIADIIRDADRRLHSNAAYLAELRAWTGYRPDDGAGIRPDEAGVAPAGHDLLAMRDYGGPDRGPGRDFETDPLIGVLSHRGRSTQDDVEAGAALQMVLLTATDERLATSMLSQPVELADLREDLRRITGHDSRPQMVIRIGYGQPGPASTRRDLDDVIDA